MAQIDKLRRSSDTFHSMEEINKIQACTRAGAPGRSVFLAGMLLCGAVMAETAPDWAVLAQNSMADVIKMPLGNQFDFGYGHKDQVRYSLLYTPSMVSELTDHWKIVNRFDISFIYQPGTVPGEKDSFGFGDATYESFVGPSGERTFYWGAGPAIQIPTATDNQLGSRKWSAGLAGTGTFVKGPIVAGARFNHLWSFAGNSDRPDVNLTTFEYYLYANLARGWWIGSSPVNTANWEAVSGEEWTVPVGGGIGKVVVPNRVPINLKLEAYSYVEAPPDTADWTLMLSFEFLFTADLLFMQ
jgi:hypothetical protein